MLEFTAAVTQPRPGIAGAPLVHTQPAGHGHHRCPVCHAHMNPHAPPPCPSRAIPLRGLALMWLWLLLCCLVLSAASGRPAAAEKPPPPSRLAQLAMTLGDAPQAMQADFAVMAIAHMVEAYSAAAERARLEAAQLPPDRDPGRWAGAVDAYAAELRALAGRINTETIPVIRIGPENTVTLVIDGTPVMVNGPQAAQQAAFEQQIIERFCGLYLCEELLTGYQAPLPVSRPEKSVTQWSFSQNAGPVCSTADGLEFQFRDMENLSGYRAACARIVAELDTLARGIERSRSSGVRLDWSRLAIQALPGSERHQVELNTAGAVILAPLPGLAATPELFTLLRPWLAARVNGKSYRLVVINADRQLAPLLGQAADDRD